MTRPEFPVRVLPSGRTSTTTNGRTAPKASHLHLGPIGVAPEAQGQHIGYRLMTQYCEALAESAESGYLETDRPENVGFYRRFGFETTEGIQVIGVRNYLMWRPVTNG